MCSNDNEVERCVDGTESARQEQGEMAIAVPDFFARKAIWMRVVAAVLLVVFLPLILLLMLIVRLSSSGPALYRQKRLGKNNQEFNVLKIRTMYRDAETVTGPVLCLPGDSRVTPIGRVLRYLHLDELPQLVNVVRGEMCLVGPRPERVEIIYRNGLRTAVPGFDERVSVLPGVTGLAQINLPADVDAVSVESKIRLDLEYIRTASANLDLRILLCTALRMLGVRHGRAVRWLNLARDPHVAHSATPPMTAPISQGSESPHTARSNGSPRRATPGFAPAYGFAARNQLELVEVVDTVLFEGAEGDAENRSGPGLAGLSPPKPR